MMTRLVSMSAVRVFACGAALVLASQASAQTGGWTSTDVGAVTVAGGATESSGVWTVSGDGSDIWGTADSFQFLSRPMTAAGVLTVRVMDLQNTSPFAKAGLMFRSSMSPDAATVVVDVKPDGGVELLARNSNGASMAYLGGTTVTLPAWLRLEHTLNGGTNVGVSQNGYDWQLLREELPVSLGSSITAGIAVTSHDPGQLNVAHFDHLSLNSLAAGWLVAAVGDATPGSASGDGAEWTVSGAGSDIWGAADSFEFVYRDVFAASSHVTVRVDDLQNTNEFAKAGVMLRSSLDPGSPMVIVALKPNGAIEYMVRYAWGGDVTFLGGIFPPPVHRWLDLSWRQDGTKAIVTAMASPDKVNWVSLGPPALIPWSYLLNAGIAVTSHQPDVLNTAHFSGFALLSNTVTSDDIGTVGTIGGAVEGFLSDNFLDMGTIVVGAGSDIWGTADSFQFVHAPADTTGSVHALSSRIASFAAAHPFAKAGFMFRDSLDPGAAHVILDVKPDGGVEFMARLCTGCETTYLGGTTVTLPAYLSLFRDGSTFSASVLSGDLRTQTSLGTVTITMAAPIPGTVVTSHDPSHVATAVFDNPPR